MAAPAAPTLTAEERAFVDDLLRKLAESKKADAAWKEEKNAAERRWAARRDEIRAAEPLDNAASEEAARLEALIAKTKNDHKHDLRAAAAERDAIIAKAKAEYAKKEDTLRRELAAHKAALKEAKAKHDEAMEDYISRARSRMHDERPSFFAKERELHEASLKLDRVWRDPANGAPKHVRDAFWAAYREA